MNKLVELGYTTEKVYNQYKDCFDLFLKDIAPKLATEQFYPDDEKIFRALNECKDPKVVILAQDPYFDGSSIGLAFDNKLESRKVSPSLRNILKEMLSDIGDDSYEEIAEARSEVYDSYLGHLPDQGVLLVNTALTVRPNEAGSHTELWKPFTVKLIETLSKQDNIVWILWGNHAKSYKKFITNETHHVIEGTHPMPLAANRGGFFGEKFFSKTNDYLKEVGKTPIQW